MYFVAYYVITDQSDCSIGVQYIAHFCSFTSFTQNCQRLFFCFPIRMAFLRCNRCNKSDIGYILVQHVPVYCTRLCVFLHSAAPRAKPQTRAIYAIGRILHFYVSNILYVYFHITKSYIHNNYTYHTVEPPNKGHVGDNINSAAVSFVERLSSLWRFNMYWK